MRMKMKGEDRISNEDKSRDETAGETKRDEDKKKVMFLRDTPWKRDERLEAELK